MRCRELPTQGCRVALPGTPRRVANRGPVILLAGSLAENAPRMDLLDRLRECGSGQRSGRWLRACAESAGVPWDTRKPDVRAISCPRIQRVQRAGWAACGPLPSLPDEPCIRRAPRVHGALKQARASVWLTALRAAMQIAGSLAVRAIRWVAPDRSKRPVRVSQFGCAGDTVMRLLLPAIGAERDRAGS